MQRMLEIMKQLVERAYYINLILVHYVKQMFYFDSIMRLFDLLINYGGYALKVIREEISCHLTMFYGKKESRVIF